MLVLDVHAPRAVFHAWLFALRQRDDFCAASRTLLGLPQTFESPHVGASRCVRRRGVSYRSSICKFLRRCQWPPRRNLFCISSFACFSCPSCAFLVLALVSLLVPLGPPRYVLLLLLRLTLPPVFRPMTALMPRLAPMACACFVCSTVVVLAVVVASLELRTPHVVRSPLGLLASASSPRSPSSLDAWSHALLAL